MEEGGHGMMQVIVTPFPEGTAENSETSQGSRCTVRDPNKAPAAYKTKDTAEPVMITSQ
jgi:hypothetical protein